MQGCYTGVWLFKISRCMIWDLYSKCQKNLWLGLNTDSTPRCLYLCCWRCRSRSPAPRWTWWLCWRPAQRRGWVEASAPHAPAFVLEDQNEKPRRLVVGPKPVARRVSPPRDEKAYRRRGEDTDSLRGLWPATRPPLRRSHRTLLHCSYPAVPRSPLSWPPATKTALFIHTHTRPAVESSQARMTHHNLSTLINISKYQQCSSTLSKKKKANEYTDNMQTFNSRWLTRRGCSTWLGFCYLQSLTSLTERKIKSPR